MALILVADDDVILLEMVADALRARGYLVGTLDDGVRVAEVVTLKRPSLVILDCSMPSLSGLDALRRIRASATCFETPVLMLTGRRSDADEQIAMRAGANGYLRKPFEIADLVECAEQLMLEATERLKIAAR